MPFLGLAAVIVAVQILGGVLIYFLIDSWPARGTFGDMFGVINALFSGLALAGIIYAILLQREELKLQRMELEMTRKELERSAGAQEKTSEHISNQLEIMKSTQQYQMQKDIAQAEPHIAVSKRQRGNAANDRIRCSQTLVNLGERISDIDIECDLQDVTVSVRPKMLVRKNEELNLYITYPKEVHDQTQELSPFDIKLIFQDKLNRQHTWYFQYDPINDLFKKTAYELPDDPFEL